MESLTCPGCGANMEPANKQFLTCPYCETSVHNSYYNPDLPQEDLVEEDGGEEETVYLDDMCLDMFVEYAENHKVNNIGSTYFGNPIEQHKKLVPARQYFEIPDDDDVYLIYDSTVFGSCKKGFAVAASGIYYSADNNAGVGSYTWEEFIDNDVSYEDGTLTIGDAEFVCGNPIAERLGDFLIELNEDAYNSWYEDE